MLRRLPALLDEAGVDVGRRNQGKSLATWFQQQYVQVGFARALCGRCCSGRLGVERGLSEAIFRRERTGKRQIPGQDQGGEAHGHLRQSIVDPWAGMRDGACEKRRGQQRSRLEGKISRFYI